MASSNIFDACSEQMRRQLQPVMSFSLAANLLMLVSSIYMLQVFDRVLTSGSTHTLFWLTVAAMVGVAAYGLLEQARRRMLARTGVWLDAQLSEAVVRRSVEARLAGVRSEAGPSDVSEIKAFVSGEAILAFLDAPWMPVFIGVIWLMHPALGAVAVVGAVLLFGLAVLNDILTRGPSMQTAGAARALQGSAQAIIDHGETLRPLGMVSAMLARWKRNQIQVHAATQRTLDVTETISNITRATRLALQILILGIGATLVLRGQLSSGGMIAASIIMGRALSPVERALGAWRTFVSARQARRNLRALFEATPDRDDRMVLAAPKGRLVLEEVRYAPVGAEEPILKRVDLAIEAGTTCGVLGPSGSGKSTLCRLIVGAWAPVAGHVRLDGADVSSWDPAELGPHIGYLPQQVELFPGTIAENIARMGQVDSAKVARAAMLADVHDMILRLPEGYETQVGQFGDRLSGGQRQRIGLARALYGDPKLVVLDEPNSNLDGAGEQALANSLVELKRQGRTVVIVAHSPGVLRSADMLLVLREGVVGAFGPLDEVLKQLTVHQPRPAAPQSSYPGQASHSVQPGASVDPRSSSEVPASAETRIVAAE
ncbi:type I secretion system permease/ATPase [Bosea sp. PAMC 26642]|uniref:type I secretion system permease/ATPase n=1 Tax=Bosea sp. (strain PAMC 26642) TaxID=1792307 RepID=UPI00076FFE8B|nr:type I secretion system permease/ATPase [Bosea sp. PAMC 26642]AMJ62922.1 ABC transporter [Bosea sp. PAMC 26642]